MTRHPIQPLEVQNDVLCFKANKIVQHLLDHGGIDLNQIAVMEFSQEDREQFAQLIGYSHSGAADLSYFSDQTLKAAKRAYDTGETDVQARLHVANETMHWLRINLRMPMAELFSIHPDDLCEDNTE